MWELWKVRNLAIFEDKHLTSFKVVGEGNGSTFGAMGFFFGYYFLICKDSSVTLSGTYETFDGASQHSASTCGAGAFIKLNDQAYFNISLNVDFGTNTRSEICALWCLLHFTNVR